MDLARRILFVLIFLFCFSGFLSPPIALTLGIVFGLIVTNPFSRESRRGSPLLLRLWHWGLE
jgi:hypothetical protein